MQVYDKLKALTKLASHEALYRQIVTAGVEDQIARMPKPAGSFGYDAWGYNENAAKIGLGVVKPLYDKYFRVTAHGVDNIPTHGPVLLIANHSGQRHLQLLPQAQAAVGVSRHRRYQSHAQTQFISAIQHRRIRLPRNPPDWRDR